MMPNREEALRLLEVYSNGKKVRGIPYHLGHIYYAALAAYRIAEAIDGMDPERAYINGLLHDIGRLLVCDDEGNLEEFDQHRHPVEGYRILKSLGYERQARIAVTHAFISRKNSFRHLYSEEENWIIESQLIIPYDDYDRLAQLSDKLARLDGLCSLDTRYMQMIMDYGWNDDSVETFNKLLSLKKYFDNKAGGDIYSLIFDKVEDILFL